MTIIDLQGNVSFVMFFQLGFELVPYDFTSK